MSAISDYASLLIDAGEYAGTNDIANIFPRLVALAEAKFNRVLRVGEMESSGNVTLVSGDADLPADFLEARLVSAPDGRGLNAWSLAELDRRYGSYGGIPAGYSIVGNVMRVRPTSSGTVRLDYYAKIPALTPANPTNWLLEKAPDAYLYGLVEEIGIWKRDVETMQAGRSLKELALRGLNLQDERARWGNAQVVIGGLTP
ncbi:hypothetical protein ASG25_10640 [Rhizobium sp. Leaf384]|uniref:phage adaptor protein n=1 Tax=Rhizobium sp. Leaf384 TaxID=1736358 RepID=UPI000713B8C4|nr:hypothetical protein [Rhizobium sp. Leaf384]KQS79035.1 hypothetical protein ASG25_10640 [Rhizobium sp. Leaf384]